MRAHLRIEYSASMEVIIDYDHPMDGANKVEQAVKDAMPNGYVFDTFTIKSQRRLDDDGPAHLPR